MIMFFQMFKIQCIYCSMRGKIMLLRNNIITDNDDHDHRNVEIRINC
jgi:hypothetical protein